MSAVFIFNNKVNLKKYSKKIKRVGVVNLRNGQNIGNILVKFSMFKILEKMNVNSTIIIPNNDELKGDISFLNKTIKSHLFKIKNNFSELNEKDFDYLMVNSDKTWASGNFILDISLLKFSEKWATKKFIYGASTGDNIWPFEKYDKSVIKSLLKSFTGISFREKGMAKILEDNTGLKSEFVLDPTFLLDKQYYLNIIENYISNYRDNGKFIFIYQLDENIFIKRAIKNASEIFDFKINRLELNKSDFIENFIYGMNNSQAVITDSFHGTVFSIIFNKPFIAFANSVRGKARFDSLKEIFHLEDRIIEPSSNSHININLLKESLNINQSQYKELKDISINYLKKNLDFF